MFSRLRLFFFTDAELVWIVHTVWRCMLAPIELQFLGFFSLTYLLFVVQVSHWKWKSHRKLLHKRMFLKNFQAASKNWTGFFPEGSTTPEDPRIHPRGVCSNFLEVATCIPSVVPSVCDNFSNRFTKKSHFSKKIYTNLWKKLSHNESKSRSSCYKMLQRIRIFQTFVLQSSVYNMRVAMHCLTRGCNLHCFTIGFAISFGLCTEIYTYLAIAE